MTTYVDFNNLDSERYTKQPVATPGNRSELKVRRAWVNTAANNLNNAVVGNAMPVYDGEVIVDAWYRVKTADATSNLTVDMGINGDNGLIADGSVATANAIVRSDATALRANADGKITITPTNGVACDAAVLEVFALIIAGVDGVEGSDPVGG